MVTLYGIKNCDSVRKAIKFLKSHDIPYEFVDFNKTPVGEEEISRWLKQIDISILFNARSTAYRSLKLKEMQLDNSAKASWLAKENRLIKRPIIEANNAILVGYDEQRYTKTLC